MSATVLISNSKNNHLKILRDELLPDSQKLLIVSPFLAANILELLKEFDFSTLTKIRLITTFKPNDSDQLVKPFQLKDFYDYFLKEYPKIDVSLHIDNNLHGKIYHAENSSSQSILISSANFTRNGLCDNHEWGLLTKDRDIIDETIEGLFKSIDYEDVTYNQIKRACLFAEQTKKNHPEWSKVPQIHENILESVYSVDNTRNDIPQFFLKPVGVTEEPVLLEDKRDFSKLHDNLHFSKKYPKNVKKGDILITVAVTAGALLSYYKVTGGVQQVTDEEVKQSPWKERWPYYVEGKNLSKNFGKEWWIHNIQRKEALKEFLDLYPSEPVTYAGGQTLGTLNFGSDKVRITEKFGNFLISKINNAG